MPLLYDKFEILNDEYNSIWEFYDYEIIDGNVNLLIFDTETCNTKTGIGAENAIVSISAYLYNTKSRKVIDTSFSYEVFNPLMPIDPGASRVNGFYNSMVKNYPKFSTKIDKLTELINRADILIAHNVAFDLSLLLNEYIRAGKKMPSKRAFCTMRGLKLCVPIRNGAKGPNLGNATKYYGANPNKNSDNFHNAKYDTQCLVNIMHITLNNYKKFGKEWSLYCNHKRFVK